MHIRLLFLLLLLSFAAKAQNITSTIRGTIKDADTGVPLVGANVQLSPIQTGSNTDASGAFRFDNLSSGRYVLTVSFVGYEKLVVPEILLESGKENVQDLKLGIRTGQLAEAIVVSSRPVAFNSVQAITIEQTLRYAATYLDPARVTTSFAGVATTNDQANGLVIRGNSPNSMQWRLEGVEIVNPNHLSNAGTFSDRATQTGGGVNILSTQLLGTSYFLTGAFPAQYGNALSGVLDMNLRKGNDERTEFTAQAGLIGLDLAAEGPFSKKSKASYLANYRYSFTGLLGAMGVNFGGEDIRFQDFSFNINVPTSKTGTFTFFGLGGISSNTFKADKDTTTWEFEKDGQDIIYRNKMGAAGATHRVALGSKSSLNSTIVASGLKMSRSGFIVNPANTAENNLMERDEQTKGRVSFSSILTYRFSEKSHLKTGLYATWQTDGIASPDINSEVMNKIDGFLIQPFVSWNYNLSSRLNTEIGVHNLYYTTSKSNSFEPRAALRFQVNSSQQISFSYGLHSQLQLPQVYISGKNQDSALHYNLFLGPNKSHHFVVGYQKDFNGSTNLKVEAYDQELYNIPVSASNGAFSAVNLVETFINKKLSGIGKGRNYGVEVTFQKLLTGQYYYLISGSLYDATYVGADGIRRKSRFDGRHTFSFTGGKEFKSGESTWGVNTKILWIGGFRETPINADASTAENKTIYIENQAFSIKMKDYFRPDLRIYWKKSRAKYSRTLALDMQNISGTKNEAYSYYDTLQKQIVRKDQLGLIPVLSYRWEF